jgi:hypothetical protein
MSENKLYHMVKVTSNNVKDFSEVWAKNNLPVWEEKGARHIGSWTWTAGGPSNEILRIFEFNDFAHYNSWVSLRDDTPEGKARVERTNHYIIKMETYLLKFAPFLTQQYVPLSQGKIYHMVKVTTTNVREFSEVWAKNNLPVWEKNGVRHVGSWTYLVGGANNEILRIFEFRDYAHFSDWVSLRDDTPEGKARIARIHPYIIKAETFNLKKVPY